MSTRALSIGRPTILPTQTENSFIFGVGIPLREKVSEVDGLVVALLCLLVWGTNIGYSQNKPSAMTEASATRAAKPLITALQQMIQGHELVGAQLAIGDNTAVHLSQSFGVRSPNSKASVDNNTLFCIGSCSKPVAGTVVMAMVDTSVIPLNQTIDRWLPRYAHLAIEGGGISSRAPTVRELLAHRAGIYSQKEGLTRKQVQSIRDFKLTLAEAADRIAGEALIARPGERFAYSGAGYCVLGRVAEVAGGKSFEELLAEKLGRPLGWQRTTYFPKPGETNTASGINSGSGRQGPDDRLPHLHKPEPHLALVGGSLYSTATEIGQLARMMLCQGRGVHGRVFSPTTWQSITRVQYGGQNYGLGWGMHIGNNGTATALNHNGALFSSRSSIRVQLKQNWFLILHYTLAAEADEEGPSIVRQAIQVTATQLNSH